MWELLNNAWKGWLSYTGKGKFAALLIMVLLFFWFRREECKEKLLLVYTTIVLICCIFPVTAVVLMKIQTGFYSYEWIWSYVPLTMMIAYGGVVLTDALWRKQGKVQKGILTAVVFILIFLCGGIGSTTAELKNPKDRKAAEAIVLALSEESEGEICLWAPKEIMEVARATDGRMRLPYGRNIWDASLGAYFYEPYGKTEEALYLWMCEAQKGNGEYVTEEGMVIDGNKSVAMALGLGVNRILLPQAIAREEVQKISHDFELEMQAFEGYYLLVK